MCVHHWMIDSSDKGVCILCNKQKDFHRPEKLLKTEKKLVRSLGTEDYYMQGILRVNKEIGI